MPPSSNSVAAPRYRFVRKRWHVLFAVVDAVGAFIVRLLSKFRKTTSEPQRPHEVRRVLLGPLDHLGAAVLTTSLLPGLRERFPQATIDVLCAPWNHEVFVRREVARIFVSRWNRFQRRFAWLWLIATGYWGWKLRARRY